ncbi:hypothetical protein BJX70DRAFT_327375 [Aspergillus crustosus]
MWRGFLRLGDGKTAPVAIASQLMRLELDNERAGFVLAIYLSAQEQTSRNTSATLTTIRRRRGKREKWNAVALQGGGGREKAERREEDDGGSQSTPFFLNLNHNWHHSLFRLPIASMDWAVPAEPGIPHVFTVISLALPLHFYFYFFFFFFPLFRYLRASLAGKSDGRARYSPLGIDCPRRRMI